MTRPQGRVFSGAARQSGFTIVELVVVVVLMGILAANTLPRFFTASRFQAMGFADATTSALRMARKLAVASGCDTRVEVDASGYRLWQRASDCTTGTLSRAVSRPGGSGWSESAPGGVSVGSLDLYFDGSGRPRDSATDVPLGTPASVTVGARLVTVEPVTGFVH